jgi:hypothetical protein
MRDKRRSRKQKRTGQARPPRPAQEPAAEASVSHLSPARAWIGVAIAVAVSAILRLRLLDLPLERDEGEYAYIAQLLLQGIPPYAEAYDLKMPGVFGVYALFISIFGHSQAAIHLGLAIVNAATVALVFCLGRRLLDVTAGWVAAVSYATLSLAPSLLGLSANTEHFVVLPMLAGLLVILRASETRRYANFAISGGLLGIAFLMKQHAAFFALFAAAHFLWREFQCDDGSRRRIGRNTATYLATFFGALLLPWLAVAVWMFAAGSFSSFWFWTITYPLQYAVEPSAQQAFANLGHYLPRVLNPTWPYWALAAGGLLALWKLRQASEQRVFLLGWLAASAITLLPGLHFRPHYFLLMLPIISILGGIATSAAVARWARSPQAGRIIQIALMALPLLHLGYAERATLFESDLLSVSREIYGLNPFPESLEIARYIEQRSDDSDSILVFGSEPQIYFYSGRRSASSYIFTYELVRAHDYAATMQAEMIQQIETQQPKFVVYVNLNASWIMQPDTDRRILNWFADYIESHYEQVGLIDILGPQDTRYYWDQEQVGQTPESEFWLSVYKRTRNETQHR